MDELEEKKKKKEVKEEKEEEGAKQQQQQQQSHDPVVPFKAGSPMFIAGPSNSGKTFWVQNLLTNAQVMFDRPPTSITYCYSVYQPLYDSMKKTVPVPITFHEGLLTEKDFDQMTNENFHIIVLDDLMDKIVASKEMMELFTKYCHHKDITAILITQNVFIQGVHSRTISLNSHVFVLFANRRDEQQIMRLARQFYPTEWKDFMSAYKDATSEPFGYLIIDITPTHPRILQLRTRIFPEEFPFVYSIAYSSTSSAARTTGAAAVSGSNNICPSDNTAPAP